MDENFSNLVMECRNCHLQFYASELKVEAGSNLLICVNCYTLPGSEVRVIKDRPVYKRPSMVQDKAVFSQQSLEKKPIQKEASLNLPEGYTLFACRRCNYSFTRKNDYNRECPYCSRQNLSVLKKN